MGRAQAQHRHAVSLEPISSRRSPTPLWPQSLIFSIRSASSVRRRRRLAGNGVAGSTYPAPGHVSMESPRPVPPLTSDLLEEIFLRIGCPADLVRASTACAAFRRLITDPTFLRRYRSLHPPQLLGFIDSNGGDFQPIEAPHPSAAVGRAVARAGDFSFNNYLPRGTGGRWKVQDVQDGRVLLEYFSDPMVDDISFDLAVCDPLARRCLLLPPIPDDLLASVQVHKQDFLHSDALVVPSMDEEDGASFKVIAGT